MKAVRFLMPYTIGTLYNPGEIAGFETAVADSLIERGIAEPIKDKSPKAKGAGAAEASEAAA
jgi:hypothetical protein